MKYKDFLMLENFSYKRPIGADLADQHTAILSSLHYIGDKKKGQTLQKFLKSVMPWVKWQG